MNTDQISPDCLTEAERASRAGAAFAERIAAFQRASDLAIACNFLEDFLERATLSEERALLEEFPEFARRYFSRDETSERVIAEFSRLKDTRARALTVLWPLLADAPFVDAALEAEEVD